MRTEGFRRGVISVSLILALVISMAFIATPVLAPLVIYEPGGTTIEVEPGQEFTLRFRLRWDIPGELGYFSLGIYWDCPENDPSENFTLENAAAYFDLDDDNLPDPGLDPIDILVDLYEAPMGTGMRYAIVVHHDDGDPRDGEFNVDLRMRASGAGDVPHAPTNNHPIVISGTIDVPEGATWYSYSPPNPYITVRVLAQPVWISPSYQSGPPGSTLEYTVTITNTGAFADTYELTVSDNENWGPSLSENLFENVAPGENRQTTLSVVIPENAVPCTEDNITVTATSQENVEVSDSASCIAHVAHVFIPRPPIYIDGNDNFIPANGVTSGSGTENDPYIIENWDISAKNAHGIEIRETTAHFIIRNCYIHDGKDGMNNGIHFDNVRNGKIDNVASYNSWMGIMLWDSDNNLVTNNLTENNCHQGIHLWNSSNNLVTNNLTENNHYAGILLWNSDNNLVTNNLTENNGTGIHLDSSDNNLVINNLAENNCYIGIYLELSSNNLVTNNLTENNHHQGIRLELSDNNLVTNNIAENNGEGINLDFSSNNLVTNNLTENNRYNGIRLYDSDNNLVTNNIAENNETGINLELSDNNLVSNNIAENNRHQGILLWNSDNNLVTNNLTENNGHIGINLDSSSNNLVSNNIAENNRYHGILLWDSDNNLVTNNIAENNGHQGINLELSDNNLVTKNLTENNHHAGISLWNSDNNLIENCTLKSNSWHGIELWNHCRNNLISNCTAENNDSGIRLGHCDNNLISNCTCENNRYYGIHLDNSDNNTLDNNTCENNNRIGIPLWVSSNNTLNNNTCENNDRFGIELWKSINNTLSNNTCKNNKYEGIWLHYYSDNNTLTNNTCENNYYGINLWYSDNNHIYHNNFVNNNRQAEDEGSNYWDNGYPSGGNYWSDYTGADNYRGENQDIPGGDGIGDTPYIIPGDNNQDRYPLMNPWSPITRGVEVSISPAYQSGPPGTTLVYTVTVKNIGGVEDNYSLTVSDNENWSPTLDDNMLEVPAGENRHTTLSVNIPEEAEPCTEDNITVTATSQENAQISDNISCIAHALLMYPLDVIVRGKDTAHNINQTGDPPWYKYEFGDRPVVMVAGKVGSGGIVAAGIAPTCRTSPTPGWKHPDNPLQYLDILFDEAFRWMVPGAVDVLWYEGYNVYNTASLCSELVEALELAGYTVTPDATMPITSGLLSAYDIVVLPPLQLGTPGTGGDPNLLPDADVQAIKNFVEGGGGLLIMDSSDFGGHHFSKVMNKVLESLDFGYFFQDDQVSDPTNNWAESDFRPIADVDPTTDIGSAYQAGTGTTEIGLYSICSLARAGPGVSLYVLPDYQVGMPGDTIEYIITVSNPENPLAEDLTYNISADDNADWILTLEDNSLYVPIGEYRETTLSATIPADTSLSNEDTIVVTAVASGHPEVQTSFITVAHAGNRIEPTDDAYVSTQDNDANYNAENYLRVGRYYDFWQWPYLQFDLSEIPPGTYITDARLYLYCYYKYAEGFDVLCHEVENDNWTEGTITWKTKPMYGSTLDTKFVDAASLDSPKSYSWDVTSFVVNEFAGDNRASFCLRPPDNLPESLSRAFWSRELYENRVRPFLRVSYITEVPEVEEWDALITATFSGGSDDAFFSVRPDATPGFDNEYDIPEPPPPVAPYVRTFFYYPGQTPDELHRSCLAPENLMEWPLRIEYADGVEDVTLTWGVENIPLEYSVHLYRGENFVADMKAEDNYTFEASTGSYDFRIFVGNLLPFTLKLNQGWNMISFPVLPEDSSPDAIFGSYYALYRWDAENRGYVLHADSGSYIEPDPDVEAGVGYWAYVLQNENVDLLGVPVNRLTLSLHQGWNLIGPPYAGSSIADPIDDPDNTVLSWAFTWDENQRRYVLTQLFEPGKGYWVYAFKDCSLVLS